MPLSQGDTHSALERPLNTQNTRNNWEDWLQTEKPCFRPLFQGHCHAWILGAVPCSAFPPRRGAAAPAIRLPHVRSVRVSRNCTADQVLPLEGLSVICYTGIQRELKPPLEGCASNQEGMNNAHQTSLYFMSRLRHVVWRKIHLMNVGLRSEVSGRGVTGSCPGHRATCRGLCTVGKRGGGGGLGGPHRTHARLRSSPRTDKAWPWWAPSYSCPRSTRSCFQISLSLLSDPCGLAGLSSPRKQEAPHALRDTHFGVWRSRPLALFPLWLH